MANTSTSMTTAAGDQPPSTLPELGAYLARQLREHFPRHNERDRQVLALAEEAGEFVGAYRRATGMARRTGSWADVEAELADVTITAHVTAHILDLDVKVPPPVLGHEYPQLTGDPEVDRHYGVMNVSNAVGFFLDLYTVEREIPRYSSAMLNVVYAANNAADLLGIDLDAAIQAKTAQIITRGWREDHTMPPEPHHEGRAVASPDRPGGALPQPLPPEELHALVDRADCARSDEPVVTGAEARSLIRNIYDLDATAVSLGQAVGRVRAQARRWVQSDDPQTLAAGRKLLAMVGTDFPTDL